MSGTLSWPASCSALAGAGRSSGRSAQSSSQGIPCPRWAGRCPGDSGYGPAHRSRQGSGSPCSVVPFPGSLLRWKTLMKAAFCGHLSGKARIRSPPWPSPWWCACGTAPACWHRKAPPPGSRAALWSTAGTGSPQSVPPAPCQSTGTSSGWWVRPGPCAGASRHSPSRWGTSQRIWSRTRPMGCCRPSSPIGCPGSYAAPWAGWSQGKNAGFCRLVCTWLFAPFRGRIWGKTARKIDAWMQNPCSYFIINMLKSQ